MHNKKDRCIATALLVFLEVLDPSFEVFVDGVVVETVDVLRLEDIRTFAVREYDLHSFSSDGIDQEHRDDRRSRTGLDAVKIHRGISHRYT